jgi:hypothetical protein
MKAPTVGFDDRPTNCKSQSRSLGFCCKERFEDTLLVFAYSHPRVSDSDLNTRSHVNDIRTYPQQARTIGDRVHRLDCVHNQVHKHFFQLHSIAKQLWKSLAQLS